MRSERSYLIEKYQISFARLLFHRLNSSITLKNCNKNISIIF